MSHANVEVDIAGIKMKNPVMPASGTFSEDLAKVVDFHRLGALVTKSVTPEPRMGNLGPRVAETTAGMINAVGIQSKGAEAFMKGSLPFYQDIDSPLIVSVSADTAAQFAEITRRLSVEPVKALEVNISCPNLEDDGKSFAMDPDQTYRVIKSIRESTPLPLLAKLTPNASNITDIAMAAEEAGAEGLVIANTLLSMAIDVKTRRPKIGNVMGGLSGPAIKPIIVRMVYQIAQKVNIPIIGCGGISSVEDVIEYLLAGASAVQVGTYSFVNPKAMEEIIHGLQQYLQEQQLSSVQQLVGAVQLNESVDMEKAAFNI